MPHYIWNFVRCGVTPRTIHPRGVSTKEDRGVFQWLVIRTSGDGCVVFFTSRYYCRDSDSKCVSIPIYCIHNLNNFPWACGKLMQIKSSYKLLSPEENHGVFQWLVVCSSGYGCAVLFTGRYYCRDSYSKCVSITIYCIHNLNNFPWAFGKFMQIKSSYKLLSPAEDHGVFQWLVVCTSGYGCAVFFSRRYHSWNCYSKCVSIRAAKSSLKVLPIVFCMKIITL